MAQNNETKQTRTQVFDVMKSKLLYFVLSVLFSVNSVAQNTMRISYTDGNMSEVPIGQIDNISFIEKAEESRDASVTGGWFWGSQEQGYYEVLTFDENHTYTGYDNYFSYGFDTMTYGFYSQYGTMLTLWSNGFGYNRRYNWFITSLTGNALEVMTKMGPFTYFRLQPEVIHIKVDESLVCEDGDSFIFSDGIVARIDGNKLYGVKEGTTYIQKRIAKSNLIYAYKVIVE